MLRTWAIGIGAVLAGSFFAVPATAEVTRTVADGFVSRHEVSVKASPKDVWLALITPSRWWNAQHTWSGDAKNLVLTPQAGGCFCETIPEVSEPGRSTLQGSAEHMQVIQAYPEKALRMRGALGPLQSEPVMGVLTIAISEREGETRIVWEYNVGGTMRYEVPVIAGAVDKVIGVQAKALADLLGPLDTPSASKEPASAADAGKPAPAPKLPGEAATKAPGKQGSVADAFRDLTGDRREN